MRRTRLAVVPLLSAVAGCAATGGDTGDAETATQTSAVIIVERTSDGAQGSRAEASARFVRLPAGAPGGSALRSVGAGLDVPPAGACSTLSALAALAAAEPAPVVELLDVGPVSLEVNGVATHLVPRQLPDVTDVVSGVVYARAAEANVLPASAIYVVHVAGGVGLAALDVPASAPADATDIRIQGEDADAGGVVVGRDGTTLSWNDDGSEDQVYVDLQPSGVRCLLESGGHGSIPAAFFDEAGTLGVHRLHREPLRARGIDSGELRFDFARVVGYVRR